MGKEGSKPESEGKGAEKGAEAKDTAVKMAEPARCRQPDARGQMGVGREIDPEKRARAMAREIYRERQIRERERERERVRIPTPQKGSARNDPTLSPEETEHSYYLYLLY